MKPLHIEIWSDYACPFCFIGKARLEKALKALALEATVTYTYKAYQLNPFAPPEIEDSAYQVYEKKLNIPFSMAKDKLDSLTLLGKEEGLVMNFGIVKMTNTLDAHRLVKLPLAHLTTSKLVQLLMEAYFTEGKNLSDISSLSSIANQVGLSRHTIEEWLKSEDKIKDVEEDVLEARSLGIRGVPYFLINRTYAISGAQSFETFKATLAKASKI